jgi:hypothetical protein
VDSQSDRLVDWWYLATDVLRHNNLHKIGSRAGLFLLGPHQGRPRTGASATTCRCRGRGCSCSHVGSPTSFAITRKMAASSDLGCSGVRRQSEKATTEGKHEPLGSTDFLEQLVTNMDWIFSFVEPLYLAPFQPSILKIERSCSISPYPWDKRHLKG